VAFHGIFAVANVVVIALLIRYLKHIPSWFGRGPYIFLTVVSFILVIGNIVGAAYTRFSDKLPRDVRIDLSGLLAFLMEADLAFRPAAVLYLIHIRGIMLKDSQQKGSFYPAMSRLWKRIFDWAIAAITLVIWITYIGYTSDILRRRPRLEYLETRQRLLDAGSGLSVALYCVAIISPIFMFVQIKFHKFSDKVYIHILFFFFFAF
jgi:hypothetical protein